MPSFAASSGETAAITLLASSEKAKTLNNFFVVFIRFQFLLILFWPEALYIDWRVAELSKELRTALLK